MKTLYGNGRMILMLICATNVMALPDNARTAMPPNTRSTQRLEWVRRQFASPPMAYHPMIRWWWPGGDVTDGELRREIGIINAAGFGGVEIQPFSMGLGYDLGPKVNDYLTPSFWARVQTALVAAKACGMWVDFTFGSGWPFGGAHIPLNRATKELRFTHYTVQGPGRYSGKLELPSFLKTHEPDAIDETMGWVRPSEAERTAMVASQQIVAVIAMKGTAADAEKRGEPPRWGQQRYKVVTPGLLDPKSAIVLTDRVDAEGRLEWDVPQGEWQIFLFARNPVDKTVLAGVGQHPQRILDHLDHAAMEAHLQAVGASAQQNIGKYFGDSLRAIFCDSLEVEANLFWTDSFFEEFRHRRGYDLVKLLPFLKQPGRGENYSTYQSLPFYNDSEGLAEGVRNDYWLTVSELLTENFFRPFVDWAHQQNLMARIQAHGAQGDIMAMYALADIPETETLAHNGRPEFLHMASSVADQQGKPIASAECFVHPGNPYATTPDLMKKEADTLFLAGINQLVYHGFPYRYTTSKGEPWHPFVAPLPFTTMLNDRNPFWRLLLPLNTYVARMQLLSQSGRSIVPVAVFDMDRSGEDSERLKTAERRETMRAQLAERGMSCDRLGNVELLRTKVEDGRLITVGGMAYQGLIVLGRERIRIEEAQAIAAMVDQHVPVLFVDEVPFKEAGYLEQEARSQQIRKLLNGIPNVSGAVAAADWISEHVSPNIRFSAPVTQFSFLEKAFDDARVYFLRNESSESRSLDIELRGSGSPERWDAWTGKTFPVKQFSQSANGVKVHLQLAPMETTILVLDPEHHHPPETIEEKTELQTMPIDGSWAFEVDGRKRTLESLFDWSSDAKHNSFSGTASYSTDFTIPAKFIANYPQVRISLGKVGDVAEITLNGIKLLPLLFSPYVIDVTKLVHPGLNEIEIRITNSQTNAELARGADLDGIFNKLANRTPAPAGLMGPVHVEFLRSSFIK